MSMNDVLVNLSAEPNQVILGWLERANALVSAKRVVSLPDTCPGKSPVPTGTGYMTDVSDWRRFALSDVGCGIAVVRTSLTFADTTSQGFRDAWDGVCADLGARRNQGLGDLGSGNHFLDAVVSYEDESVGLVVHTGSRKESGLVDDLVDRPAEFDREFERIKGWAKSNRDAVLEIAERHLGRFVDLYPGVRSLDRNHNHFEERGDGVLIRKGSQRVEPGELALIPSNLLDDMVIVRATARVEELMHCLPHGTGRTMSRSDAKRATEAFDFGAMRQTVYIPERITDASLRTEAPICYRALDDGLALVSEYVEVVERLVPVAYIGQL
ncbi:MAG: RtcB family protein [Planctomycetota bacterium]